MTINGPAAKTVYFLSPSSRKTPGVLIKALKEGVGDFDRRIARIAIMSLKVTTKDTWRSDPSPGNKPTTCYEKNLAPGQT